MMGAPKGVACVSVKDLGVSACEGVIKGKLDC